MSLGNSPVQMMPYLTPEAAQIYKNLMAYMGPLMSKGASAFPGQLNAAPDPNQIAGNDIISRMMGKGKYTPNAYPLKQNVKVPQGQFNWQAPDRPMVPPGQYDPGGGGGVPPGGGRGRGGGNPEPQGGDGGGPFPQGDGNDAQMMALMQAINDMYNPQGYNTL